MGLIFEENNGIGVLKNPQQVDISLCNSLSIQVPKEYSYLLINKSKYELNNGVCLINVRNLEKGTNTIKAVDVSREKILPCQPFNVFESNDKIKCTLATSLDVLRLLDELQGRLLIYEQKVNNIEAENIGVLKDKINELVNGYTQLQERVKNIEAGFDPTLI